MLVSCRLRWPRSTKHKLLKVFRLLCCNRSNRTSSSCISILESKGVSLRLSDHLHLQFLWLTLLEIRVLLGANLTFEGKARCQALSRAYLCSRSCSDFPLRNSRQRHTEQVAKYQQDTQLRQSACLAACLPLGGPRLHTSPAHTILPPGHRCVPQTAL